MTIVAVEKQYMYVCPNACRSYLASNAHVPCYVVMLPFFHIIS